MSREGQAEGLGAVTCHGAAPACPHRQLWGLGRLCPARGAEERLRKPPAHRSQGCGMHTGRVPLSQGAGVGAEGNGSALSRRLPPSKHLQDLLTWRETSPSTEGRDQVK